MMGWIKRNKGELIIAFVPSVLIIFMSTIVVRQFIIDRFSDLSGTDKIIVAYCSVIAVLWLLISYSILDFKNYMQCKSD